MKRGRSQRTARAERKRGHRWLTRVTAEDLGYCPSSVLSRGIELMQAEYDRRHKYTLFYWGMEKGCGEGVAILQNDPRYQRDWETEVKTYLRATNFNLKVRTARSLTKREVEQFARQNLADWDRDEPQYFAYYDFTDYPEVSDPQAYLANLISV